MKNSILSKKEPFKSVMVIVIYFILPYIVNLLSDVKYVSVVLSLLYLLLIIYLYRDTIISDFKKIAENKKKSIIAIITGVVLIFVSMLLLNVILEVIFNIKGTSENDWSLKKIFDSSPIFLMILTCIYYPIVEGIVFRKALRDIIDKKWLFIIFSSLFYFLFNIIYTSMSLYSLITSICYFTSMFILSTIYYKSDNFILSVLILSIYNLIFSLLNFI